MKYRASIVNYALERCDGSCLIGRDQLLRGRPTRPAGRASTSLIGGDALEFLPQARRQRQCCPRHPGAQLPVDVVIFAMAWSHRVQRIQRMLHTLSCAVDAERRAAGEAVEVGVAMEDWNVLADADRGDQAVDVQRIVSPLCRACRSKLAARLTSSSVSRRRTGKARRCCS